MEKRKNQGYEIIDSKIIGESEIVLGAQENGNEFVTWQVTVGKPDDYYWGHYFTDKATATKNFHDRISEKLEFYIDNGLSIDPKDYDLHSHQQSQKESQYMKNLTELTIVQTYEFKGNNFGDIFEKIVDIGYDEENAQDKALDALRYACCKDFTNPVYCSKGTVAEYFKTEGVKLENGYDEEELAEFLKCDYIVILEYKGNEYALRDDFISYTDGGKFISDEVRQFDRWDDVKPHMDADKIPKSEQKESSQSYISLKSLKQLADNQKATQNDIKSQHRSDELRL